MGHAVEPMPRATSSMRRGRSLRWWTAPGAASGRPPGMPCGAVQLGQVLDETLEEAGFGEALAEGLLGAPAHAESGVALP